MPPPAKADPVADFYKGKQLILVVGYAPGGGYDVYARLVARHLGKFIPGEPVVVVQNMPGAGSLRSANHIYNAAPRDGSQIGTFARNMPLMGILGGNKNVQFDPRKFTWLGSPSSTQDDSYMLFVRKDAAAKTFDDLVRPGGPEVILGGTSEGATGNDVALLIREALGARVRLIAGYRDSNALFPAIERGELQGRFVGLSAVGSTQPHWLRPEGPVRVLLQFGRATRHPDYMDVPVARELAKTPEARALIESAEIPYLLSRPYVAPPDVPADRAKALQAGFMAAAKSPEFLADAKKLNVDVSPVDAQAAQKMLDQLADAPEEIRKKLSAIFGAQKK
ncbi:MAG: hypothetical protein FJX29_14120 [Alphaproteobacteria bacterium]|nr:hypothetical protein [Alphaproteobacteria bacterium]